MSDSDYMVYFDYNLGDSITLICQKQKIGIKFDEVAFLIAAM